MESLFEIKDSFLQNQIEEDVAKEKMVALGLNAPFAREIIGQWIKHKEKDFENFPFGLAEKLKAVAIFMGAVARKKYMLYDITQGVQAPTADVLGYTVDFENLKYHSSWDWLIPVWKKCAEISRKQNRPTVNHCSYLDWLECEISTSMGEFCIEATFEFVVDFVYHFNKK